MKETNLEEWHLTRQGFEETSNYSIYENDDQDIAVYCSQIEEWGILKFCTKIQIIKNKSTPQKIFDGDPAWFLFYDLGFIYDWTVNNLIGLRLLKNTDGSKFSFPFIVINYTQLSYTIIHGDIRMLSMINIDAFKAEYQSESEPDQIFQIKELIWHPLDNFAVE